MIEILYWVGRVVQVTLFLYCLLSWFPALSGSRLQEILSKICDPVLDPIRKLLYKIPFFQSCPIDLSPLLLGMLVSFLLP